MGGGGIRTLGNPPPCYGWIVHPKKLTPGQAADGFVEKAELQEGLPFEIVGLVMFGVLFDGLLAVLAGQVPLF